MVIAIKELSRVFMASDSLYVQDEEHFYGQQKIWKCEPNEVIMGGEGDPYVVQQAQTAYPFPHDTPDYQNVAQYLNSLIDTYSGNWEFLIGGNGKIFFINSHGLLIEENEYGSIGYGRSSAQVMLNITRGENSSENRLKMIINNISLYNQYVGGEIHVLYI